MEKDNARWLVVGEDPKVKGVVVLAVGGNSIVKPTQKGEISEQIKNIDAICQDAILPILKQEYKVVLVFGKAPLIRNMLVQQEIASEYVPQMPFDVVAAGVDGQLAYLFSQALYNLLIEEGFVNRFKFTVTMIQMISEKEGFLNPLSFRPVAPLLGEDRVRELKKKGWLFMRSEDGLGYHRLLPSIIPRYIVQCDIVEELLLKYSLVMILGSGVTFLTKEDGRICRIEALVDKDIASACLASSIGADVLLILTNVEKVAINYGRGDQVDLDCVDVKDLKSYINRGFFPSKSMEPKVRAAVMFVESGGKEAIITTPSCALLALEGRAGTRVVKGK
ncbi:Carbamate kinase 2 [bacterium HR37]|nr:Carbamate kinase 2 [bacterium HR37]